MLTGVRGMQAYSTRVLSDNIASELIRMGWEVQKVFINAKTSKQSNGLLGSAKEFWYRYLLYPKHCRKIIPKDSLVLIVDHADSFSACWLTRHKIFIQVTDLLSLRPIWDFPFTVRLKNVLIWLPSTFLKRKGLHKALHLFTISNSTKDELLRYTSIKNEMITVAHLGVSLTDDASVRPMDIAIKIYDQPKECILTIGVPSLRKNYRIIAKALEQESYLRNKYYWLHIGEIDRATKYILDQIGFDSLYEYSYVKDIRTAYKRANILIQSSHYEGFGLPPLEAMKMGTVTISSDIPVAREIYSNHAIYFDKDSAGSLINAIMQTKELPDNWTIDAKNYAQTYQWQKTAKIMNDKFCPTYTG